MTESIHLPRVLLTNDDGIEAPGLKVLTEIAEQFSNEIWIVAPEHEVSGNGQSISLTRPVHVWQSGERAWATDGTPGDCVALALSHFMIDTPPSLVLSGINAGHNVGDNVNMSGTIGAALTALMHGIPAIAISQSRADGSGNDKKPWETTRAIAPKVLKALLMQGWRKETCLSVNIPALPPEEITGFSWARQSQKNVEALIAKKRTSPRHDDYYWITIAQKPPAPAPNSEHAIMKRGEVAVTALALDRSVDISKPSILFNGSDSPDPER